MSISSIYETTEYLDQYMVLHYGSPQTQMPFEFGPHEAVSFPQRCADLVIESCDQLLVDKEMVLDLGCAVGGASFRLAEQFNLVQGIDLSQSFIDMALSIKKNKSISFNKISAHVQDEAAGRTQFRQGDACNLSLSEDLGQFDAVLMANLICRLPDPAKCLSNMKNLIKQGGLLVITSPYSWSETYTPREKWLNGLDDIKSVLKDDFQLLDTQDMPFLIQEHYRKYQYVVSQASVWQHL